MAYDDNVAMLGDDSLFGDDPLLQDPLVKQRARSAALATRRNPALATPTSGSVGEKQPLDYTQEMGPSPAAPSAAAGGSAGGATSDETLLKMYERMNQRPDPQEYIDQQKRREQEGSRKLMLGLTLGAMGGKNLSPFGKQFSEQGMKEAGDYEIPGGWGTVTRDGVVWNAEKQRQADLALLQHIHSTQSTREARKEATDARTAQTESGNLLRMAIAANKPAPQEPLVPVYDPATQTTTYLPRSQARGLQVPPKGAAATGGRPLTTHAVDQITKNDAKVAQMGGLATSWKPEFGGLGTSVGNVHGRFNPLASDASREQAQWWQNYQEVVNDVRHGQFGAALTPTEKAEFEKAIITPNTDERVVSKYLKRQTELAEIARRRHLDNFGKAGFNVSGFLDGDGGAPAVRDGAPGAPPAGAVREKK